MQTVVSQRATPSEASARTPRARYVLAALVVVGLGVRLALAALTAGTNDVNTWLAFIDAARTHGALNLYGISEWPTVPIFAFNHGPLAALGVQFVASAGDLLPFSERFLVRLPAIVADVGSTLIVYTLVASRRGSRAGLTAAALIALNPVLILISGFHGNTDPVFVALTLAALLLLDRDRPGYAGLLFAAAGAVKIVPILLAPVILLSIRDRSRRKRFALFGTISTLVLWLPLLVANFAGVVRLVGLYRGSKEIWGFGKLLEDLPSLSSSTGGRELWTMLLLVALIFSAEFMTGDGKHRVETGVAVAFLVFLALTPGFGVQYLAWPVVFLVIASPIMSAVYSLAAGAFLYSTYAWWSGGGWSIGFANSWFKEPLWSATGETLKWAAWLVTLALAVALHTQRTRQPGDRTRAL